MLCDQRLEKIEQLVSNSLNDNATVQRVHTSMLSMVLLLITQLLRVALDL